MPSPTAPADDGGTPQAQATYAATQALVGCFLRESAAWSEQGDDVVVPVLGGGAEVRLAVTHRSRTAHPRLGVPARLHAAGRPPIDLAFPTLASLLLDALEPTAGAGPAAPAEVLARALESREAIAAHLTARAGEVDRLWGAGPLDAATTEQALLLGHPLHPAAKAFPELSPDDRAAYCPELAARFPLRWLAVHPDAVVHDSATGTAAPAMVEALLAADAGCDQAALADARRGAPTGHVLLPVHPWQLDHLQRVGALDGLLGAGRLVDLGAHGSPVLPTTSVRTVLGPGWAYQLKCSLSVRVTNSRRVTLGKELGRAVEAARLHATEVGRQARAVAPSFRLVHDPAYLTVRRDEPSRGFVDELSVLLREQPWPLGPGGADVTAVTTLCQDRPGGGPSRLGRIVGALAERSGERIDEVGRRWFARFTDVAVRSLVRLYAEVGLCFEAHQQNTLLELDGGWPVTAWYRDSQGYFHRELAHGDMARVIAGLGEATESIFPEALADERLVYYLFANLALGVVDALALAGCDEAALLADLRSLLEAERARPTRYPTTLLDRLLDDPTWPCKANLRTRLHGLDELAGDIATQSVYVTLPNPLLAASPVEAP